MAITNNGTTAADALGMRGSVEVGDVTKSAFFWLMGFFVVYCARPEDWIPGLKYIPLAKVTAILAMWGLFNSLGRTKRAFKDMPRESRLLLAMIIKLFVCGLLSPIWKGGAVSKTMDFAKIYVVFALVFLLTTTFERLRKLIYIQAASVVVVCVISMVKGHNMPRLEGVLGGIYSNPNDLAFAIVLAMPFALAFMLTAKNAFVKAIWIFGMLCMLTAIFLTASRAGFLDLIVMGTITLYHFGIKGKRYGLIAGTFVFGLLIVALAGGKLYDRWAALEGGGTAADQGAEGSYEARKFLMQRAVEGIENYPVFGIGMNNFTSYSGIWHEVHMTYLQVCVEGGIPVLILFLMFFWRGFKNLGILLRTKNLDETTVLFIGALHGSLIGFVTGALFAPEGFEFFPYFAVAFTAALLQTIRDNEQQSSPASAPPPKRGRHFLEVYADHGRTGAVTPVR